MLDIAQVCANRYSELAAAAGAAGIKRRDAAEAIGDELAELAERGEVAVAVDWTAEAERHLAGVDEFDRKHQEDRLQLAVDCLSGGTILGQLDPLLGEVCVVGQGVRKTYRNIDVGDLLAVAHRRQVHARDAAIAAERVMALAMALVDAMRVGRVDALGELWR